ncbi:MAG: hypothetical protein QUS14_11815 [Pyrinomonadaceae bacterium]|nr:hypothetical protein [Pyrinomonadaceae bacterium]
MPYTISVYRLPFRLFAFLAFLLSLFGFASDASAQRRDYMTDAEIEIVRDAQDIDLRIEALTRMIDRRFTALGVDVGGWTPREKDLEKWGDAPTGTRAQLFMDIRRLLEKAIDDIDVIAQRNEDALKQNKVNGELFPVAVGMLEDAAKRYRTALSAAAESEKDDKDKVVISASIEHCNNIVDAAATIPAEKKDLKKRKKVKRDV